MVNKKIICTHGIEQPLYLISAMRQINIASSLRLTRDRFTLENDPLESVSLFRFFTVMVFTSHDLAWGTAI